MGKIMKANDFVNMAHIALNTPSYYVQGAFGCPATAENKIRYHSNTTYNKTHYEQISKRPQTEFFWDCVCLIKGILWGWSADRTRKNGGAIYGSSGVPDFGTENMLKYCTDVSSDFSKMELGEVLYMKGHVGIYVGKGPDGIDYAIECTPSWKNGVQFSGILNSGKSTYHPNRKWLKHGKLQFVEYESEV
ncbi:MAG: hypothetical protein MJZ03_03900 [archaeon]|nr:hypothetical protein [archaeon]